MNGYAELHCHTNFSFLDGASHPEDLVDQAMSMGYEALAVTDHDGFYGVSRFWQAAKESGLPAIYGVEVGLPSEPAPTGDPVTAAEEWDRRRHALTKGGTGRLRRGRSVR
ncbi:MAG: PHP domain-containing protein, partial [Acidimicrobiia bacterium]